MTLQLLKIDHTNKYCVYKTDIVEKNLDHMVQWAHIAHSRYKNIFGEKSSTWSFGSYNAMGLFLGSEPYYYLFKEIKGLIREFVGTDEPLWLQCWLNFHTSDQLLNWHDHKGCLFHGFVSIDPKDSRTVFEEYEVINSPGTIYLGQAYLPHKVECPPFTGKRITIAFDVVSMFEYNNTYTPEMVPDANIGLIPLC